MTDGISINQFRAQVNQGQSLDGKIKLNEEGGLKTFGKNFFGKIACWFQKSSQRKAESQDIRQSFIKALKQEYGTNESVNDVLSGIRGNTRLSLRTVQQTFDRLDTHRDSFRQKANSLYTEIMTENGLPEQVINMGYEQGSLNMTQLRELHDEITNNLAKMGPQVSETVAKSTATETIIGYLAKNLPINSVDDAIRILTNTSTKSLDDTVQRVFDHFINQEGGLEKLQNCSLRLMGLEIAKTRVGGTLLRGNSTASKMITKTLLHMTKTQNDELVRSVADSIPSEVPAPVINPETREPISYTANSSQFNNPDFFALSKQISETCLTELQNSWAKNISTETKSLFNGILRIANEQGTHLGEGVGKKSLAAVLMLRIINPLFTGKELITQINSQIKELSNSDNPDKERLINNLNGKLKTIISMSRSLQFLANTIGQEDPENFLTNSGKVPEESVPFIRENLVAFNTLLDSICGIPHD